MIALFLACSGTPENTRDPAISSDDSAVEHSDPPPCSGVEAQVTDLSPEALAEMLASKDFELINVHTPYAGEIPDTDVHLAFDDVDAIEAHLGDIDTRAVLYCKTGPMSAEATAELVDRGFCAIYDLPAGMRGWEQAGYELDE